MIGTESALIVTTMKNEGPYILEWVAHHLSIGFDGILVFTNDCADGTDRILDRLERIAPIYHRPNPRSLFGDQGSWQVMAFRYARLFGQYREAGWIYHTDADEFLWIKRGSGTLDDYMSAAGPTDAVSFSSVPYSAGGRIAFEDGLVTDQFTVTNKPYMRLAVDRSTSVTNAVKTLFRNHDAFTIRRGHRPLAPGFGASGLTWRDGSGRPLGRDFTEGTAKALDPVDAIALAQVNHYATRSGEAFLVKTDRGDVAGTDRLKSFRRYWLAYNTPGDPMPCGLSARPAFRDWHARLHADPVLGRLHAEAVAWHRARAADLSEGPVARGLKFHKAGRTAEVARIADRIPAQRHSQSRQQAAPALGRVRRQAKG